MGGSSGGGGGGGVEREEHERRNCVLKQRIVLEANRIRPTHYITFTHSQTHTNTST